MENFECTNFLQPSKVVIIRRKVTAEKKHVQTWPNKEKLPRRWKAALGAYAGGKWVTRRRGKMCQMFATFANLRPLHRWRLQRCHGDYFLNTSSSSPSPPTDDRRRTIRSKGCVGGVCLFVCISTIKHQNSTRFFISTLFHRHAKCIRTRDGEFCEWCTVGKGRGLRRSLQTVDTCPVAAENLMTVQNGVRQPRT